MRILLTVWVLSVLPFSSNSQCYQCPYGCSCSQLETTCTDLTEIPQCLPYLTRALTISNSPQLSQIRMNAFSDRSYEYLESLTIASAELETIQDYAFNGTHQLTKIQFIDTNGPTYLDQNSLHGLPDVESFIANSNPAFRSIGSHTFTAMRRLKTLNLKGNGIQFIHQQALESVYELEHFDISNNPSLVSIPQTLLSHISTLQTVAINDCSLATLHTDYFDASYMSNALVNFQAAGNDWDCDEDMCPFIQWLEYRYDFYMIANLGYCATPSGLQGVYLENVQEDVICNNGDDTYNLYMYITIAVSCIIFLMVVANVYRRRHALFPCCGDCRRHYAYIDDVNSGRDPNFDIAAHDQAAILSPNPPSYDAVSRTPASSASHCEISSHEDVPPPPYDE